MAGGGSQATVNLLTNVAKAAASLGFGATLLSSSLYTVDGGQRTVLFDRFLGILDQTVGEGTHFRVPMAPQIVASGRIIHPGSCNKPCSGGNCNHPWCGTPILVTSPIGATVSTLIANGLFGPEEALRCCHDCLSALVSASSAGIRHGDIRAENVIRVSNGSKRPFFVLIGWGHAVLEDRDRPSMNLFFSSTYALQEGKLCAASDAESLIYLLYFACGGVFPELDSVEGALQWREVSWSKRVIQQKLGDISAVLKAFADYVDSLCGTPYPIDYEIWLRRLRRTINEEDHGKETVIAN